MNRIEYTVNYLKDVLKYELHIRGYRKVNIRNEVELVIGAVLFALSCFW